MARGTALGVVRGMVKAEVGKSLLTTVTSQDAEMNQTIADTQQQLADAYDWPFLKTRWDATISPGSRYITFPTTSNLSATVSPNLERPIQTFVKWNEVWQEVIYGIDEYPEFNYLDSDRGQVLDPIQRWQFSDETKFEVWPLPASTAQLRFVGQRALTTLQSGSSWNDNATLDLDDLLVTYYVASTYLTRNKNANAEAITRKAARQLLSVRGAYPMRTRTLVIGRGTPFDRKTIRQVPLVLVAGH